MKTYTIKELDKIFDEGIYRYIALYNNKDEVLVRYNPPSMSAKEGWKKVRKRLLAKGLQDGFYVVKGKSSPDTKVTPEEFGVKIGKTEEKDLPPAQLADPPKEAEHVLSYAEALKANKEISDLTARVSQLEMELEQKDKEIEELEEELKVSDAEVTLAESMKVGNGQQYVEDLMAAAIPIADKWFELENRKMAFKEGQTNGQGTGSWRPPPSAPPPPGAQRQQPQRPPLTKEDSKKFWDQAGELLKTDPEAYQRLMQEANLEMVEPTDNEGE